MFMDVYYNWLSRLVIYSPIREIWVDPNIYNLIRDYTDLLTQITIHNTNDLDLQDPLHPKYALDFDFEPDRLKIAKIFNCNPDELKQKPRAKPVAIKP